ncbi:MAG: hypothetical protein MSA13_08875 [Prevotella sp.]|nr:hypothetical protein [Prevotella sp.]
MNEIARQNRQRIIEDMIVLLGRSASEGLVWRSSKTDLIEMVHIVYCADVLRDAQGLPLTFRELVRRACEIVHVSIPANPNQLVTRAQQRKGRRMLPLLERYDKMFV